MLFRFTFETLVDKPAQYVWENFNVELFRYLQPPFPPTTLLRYDGNQAGDEVHIELNFFLIKTTWISEITETHEAFQGDSFFVDVGKKLPFFFSSWRHAHHIVSIGPNRSAIRDEVEVAIPWYLVPLIYPGVLSQFLYRKPLYKKYFTRK